MTSFSQLRLTILQTNPHVGNLDHNVGLLTDAWAKHDGSSDLLIGSELGLTGYCPEDLLLNEGFQESVKAAIEKMCAFSKNMSSAMLLGTPIFDSTRIYNGAVLIENGHIHGTIFKHDLPNYGVFDDHRYFTSGPLPFPILFRGISLGVMICEDMWFPQVADHLKAEGAEGLVVMNGSPFEVHKQSIRLQHARLRATKTNLPLVYANQVGGQDDLVFDGASFALTSGGDVHVQCEEFVRETVTFTFDKPSNHILPLHPETESMYQAVTLGLRDYMRKTGQTKIVLGLSGGIDSALSAAIAVDAIGAENVSSVMMPSPFTSKASLDDAADVAAKLGIGYTITPITGLMDNFMGLIPSTSGLAHENLQARLRGLILMTMSNQSGVMVLTTGNKSEMATGYATLYGDMCGGYNVLKDIYKTQVYNMARWRNTAKPVDALGPLGNIINDSTLTKAPTAELREGQRDQDSLPPYDELDQILTGLIESEMGVAQMVARGFDESTVKKVARLLKISEFKRRQSAPGPKVSSRAFTRERRYPIASGF